MRYIQLQYNREQKYSMHINKNNKNNEPHQYQMRHTHPSFCLLCHQYHSSFRPNMSKTKLTSRLRYSDLFHCFPDTHHANLQVSMVRERNCQRARQTKQGVVADCGKRSWTVLKTSHPQNNGNEDKTPQTIKQLTKQLVHTLTVSYKQKVFNSIQSFHQKNQINRNDISDDQLPKQQITSAQKRIKLRLDFSGKSYSRNQNEELGLSSTPGCNKTDTKQRMRERQSERKWAESLATTAEIKKNEVYGQQDRKLLTSISKVSEMKYTDRTQSKQYNFQDKLSPTNRIINPGQQLDESKQISQQSKTQKKTSAFQSEDKQLDYCGKIKQLKEILWRNRDKDKQKNMESNTRLKKDISKIDKSNTGYWYSENKQKCTPNTNYGHKQKQTHCTYYDNRCFGLSLFNEEQIFIEDSVL